MYQRVVIGGFSSNLLTVSSRVPQGIVLEPSGFLIYVNDIKDSLQYSSINLFADEALMYHSVRNSNDVSCFQKDLNFLAQWAKTWSMVFYVDKCQVAMFDHRGQGDCNITDTLYGTPTNFAESFR